MNKTFLAWAAGLLFSLATGLPAQAQSAYPDAPGNPPIYNQQQLDQMLAPVALYPDSLLAQVLMASTYPLEVVQAQRFVEARPGLQGDGLANAVAPMPWDPSVKALVQFPSVLAMMNDRLDWMQQLGQAFLAQQATVMDTVQNLRERARIAGTLESSPQQRVLVQDEVIVIEPVNPQVVYVPYYNPVVVYGSWWWPSAPPVVWTPPPRYRPPSYQPGFSASISFSVGVGVMHGVFGDARPDWRQRQVMVNQTRITNVTNNTNIINNNKYINNNITRNVTVNQRPVVWHHDPRYGGGRYAPQPVMTQAQAARPPAPPLPAAAPANNLQQRVMQDDQARQRQAYEQQRQREQQANEQQRQREQMIRDQQRQHEQQSQEMRQQQQQQQFRQQQMQEQQRQQQMHQQQMQEQQRHQQMQDQQRQQQMRQQQMQEQQRQQQMRQQHDQQMHQQEQARREQQAHQQAPQQAAQQRAQPQRNERNERGDHNGRRDERRDERS